MLNYQRVPHESTGVEMGDPPPRARAKSAPAMRLDLDLAMLDPRLARVEKLNQKKNKGG